MWLTVAVYPATTLQLILLCALTAGINLVLMNSIGVDRWKQRQEALGLQPAAPEWECCESGCDCGRHVLADAELCSVAEVIFCAEKQQQVCTHSYSTILPLQNKAYAAVGCATRF